MNATHWPEPSSGCLRRAGKGDTWAASQILDIYREQLRRVVEARLDERLAARFDPSDVVHDVMATAYGSLPSWIQEEKALYACLYRLVRNRLAAICRDHIATQKRSVNREVAVFAELSDESVMQLCQRFKTKIDSPSQQAIRKDNQRRVQQALGKLRETDREVLVMRVIEGTPSKEVGEILGISEAAVNMRQLRALEAMHSMLSSKSGGESN